MVSCYLTCLVYNGIKYDDNRAENLAENDVTI